MANDCEFEMMIVGPAKNVAIFLSILDHTYREEDGSEPYVYRTTVHDTDDIHSLDGDPKHPEDEDLPVYTKIYGDVAWAAHHMLDRGTDDYAAEADGHQCHMVSLPELSERFDLAFEIFSREAGCCFSEHIIVSRGETKVNEDCEYREGIVDINSLDNVDDPVSIAMQLGRDLLSDYRDALTKANVPNLDDHVSYATNDLCGVAESLAGNQRDMYYNFGGYVVDFLEPEDLWDGETHEGSIDTELHYDY